MTKFVLKMPKEAAERLVKKFKDDPEAFKKHFKDLGFEIEEVKMTSEEDQKRLASNLLPNQE